MALLLLALLGTTAGCKKDPVMYGKGIETFKFTVKNAQNIIDEYFGTIAGEEIVVNVPTEVDVTTLKASFTVDNPRTIVQVGPVVQESGISEQDFTNPVAYRVKAEDKSTRTYTVRVEKKISVRNFGFYKEDNPSLGTDCKGIVKGLQINVTVPENTDKTALVARFETSTGAILKVGTVTQQSKITVNNFQAPVIYSLSDPGLTTPFGFTVSVVYPDRQWVLFGDNLTTPTAASLKMAINPLTNYPYFVYQRSGKDEAGVTLVNDRKLVSVMGYEGNSWKHIGPATGVSDFRADATGIAFSSSGEPYISYKDYLNAAQTATVMKYAGNVWTSVGGSRFSPVKSDYLSLTMGPNDVPFVAMSKTGTDATGVPARGLYVMNYQNSMWNNITPTGGITIFYDQLITGLDGKVYLGIMDRSTGVNKPSMFVYNNNAWQAIGPTSFMAPDGIVGFQIVSIAVDKNGEAYLAYQVAPSTGRMNHVMKYNKATNTWQELGNAVPSGGESNKLAIAVDPDGQLYFAWGNASSLLVKTFNNETNNWNTEIKVINVKVTEFDMQIAGDGTVYIVASVPSATSGNNNNTVVYKYGK